MTVHSLKAHSFTDLVSSWPITDEGGGIIPTACVTVRYGHQLLLSVTSEHG